MRVLADGLPGIRIGVESREGARTDPHPNTVPHLKSISRRANRNINLDYFLRLQELRIIQSLSVSHSLQSVHDVEVVPVGPLIRGRVNIEEHDMQVGIGSVRRKEEPRRHLPEDRKSV